VCQQVKLVVLCDFTLFEVDDSLDIKDGMLRVLPKFSRLSSLCREREREREEESVRGKEEKSRSRKNWRYFPRP